ncbi:hypothetical protein ES703_110597 [subsurface metagenome]
MVISMYMIEILKKSSTDTTDIEYFLKVNDEQELILALKILRNNAVERYLISFIGAT